MAGFSYNFLMLQERGLLPGPESGLSSNTQKWIVQGDTYADKARDFMGKGHPGGEQQAREPRRTVLPRDSKSQILWWWG